MTIIKAEDVLMAASSQENTSVSQEVGENQKPLQLYAQRAARCTQPPKQHRCSPAACSLGTGGI